MKLVINKIKNGHVSQDTVDEFEKAILKDSIVSHAKELNKYVFKLLRFINRLCGKFGFTIIRKTNISYKVEPLLDSKHLFTVMMGLDIYKYRSFGFLTKHNKSIFMIDAWEHDHEKIVDFVNTFKIDNIFISSLQATNMLGLLIRETKINWIPEGINPEEYKYLSYNEKNIDVLAFGRKYDLYHDQIVGYLQENEKIYLYEKVKGEIIFPTRIEFINGLAHSKVSICVTANITHPLRSGNIETMNIRYLQSIVSKCLLVGHAPKEMIQLFGYNPVIEIDMENPVEQLDEILKNYSDYIPLIEKNYQIVLKYHTWKDRWNQIKECLIVNSKN
jgi:hypothetical protein